MKLSRLFYFVTITGMVMFLFSCAGKSGQKSSHSGVEYYRSLLFSETPYDLERGTHQITPDQAKEINNYKFTWNDAGQLISVEYNRNDTLLNYGSIGGAAKIVYEYTGNKQVKHYYNSKNEPVESGGVYTAQYTLDDKGIRTGLEFFNKDGGPVENRNNIHSYVWNILPDGMVKEQRYNLNGVETVMNPFCPFYELRFTYNDKGYVTRMANYMADTLYNCTAENCGDIGVSYFTFMPDDQGDVESFSVFNVVGQMSNLYWGWSRRDSKFDNNGYVLETAYFDQDNEYVGGNNIPVTQYVYDEHGAVTEVKNMDKNRNLIDQEGSGIAVTEYKYDESGHRVETLRYNKEMQPITD
jgi:hypothetical protein